MADETPPSPPERDKGRQRRPLAGKAGRLRGVGQVRERTWRRLREGTTALMNLVFRKGSRQSAAHRCQLCQERRAARAGQFISGRCSGWKGSKGGGSSAASRS